MQYNLEYWINRGYSLLEAEERIKGNTKCAICNSFFPLSNSVIKNRPICSDECLDETIRIRIEKYKESRRIKKPCEICGTIIQQRTSLSQYAIICSEECKTIRHNNLPRDNSNQLLNVQSHIKKGYTIDEAKDIISQIQKTRSKRSAEYYINKGHSIEDANQMVSKFQKETAKLDKRTTAERKLSSHRCLEYWLNKGYSPEEAKIKLQEVFNIHSLEGHIRRFGIEDGHKKYAEFCEHCKTYNTREAYIKNYGEEEGNRKWNNKFIAQKGSTTANNFFKDLYNKLPPEIQKMSCYFKGHSAHEYGSYTSNKVGYYFYDFVITDIKYCIEFNGAYWHGNPFKFKSGDYISMQGKLKLVDDIWNYDKEKIKLLTSRGFTVKVAWYFRTKDYDKLLQECLDDLLRHAELYLNNKS